MAAVTLDANTPKGAGGGDSKVAGLAYSAKKRLGTISPNQRFPTSYLPG